MQWNPNAPATLGLEWFPGGSGVVSLDSMLKMAAVSFDQSTSQAIGGIRIPNVGIPVRGGIYSVAAYDAESAVAGAVSTLVAVPNEDVSLGTWTNQAGGTSNIFQAIDEGVVPASADFIKAGGTSTIYTGRMNTGSLSLTGQRILRVRLAVYCAIGATGLITTNLNIAGNNYFGQIGFGPSPGPIWLSKTWDYNPATLKPWTIADVQAFDTTDEWLVTAQTNAAVWSAVVVYAAVLYVDLVPETRLAVGTLDDSASGLTPNGWNTATMLTPTGGTWTKDGSGRHLVTVRRLTSSGAMSVPYLDAITDAPAIASGWSPQVDATWGTVVAMGDPTTRIMPVVLRTTAPADSDDSLPYVSRLDTEVFGFAVVQQEISQATAGSYGVIRFLVDPHTATGGLDIKVRRRSDSVQLGSTYSLSPDQARAMPLVSGTMHLAQVQLLTPATLAAGVQYYVEFSSSSQSWLVSVLTTLNVANNATYRGATDRALALGSEQDYYDVPVTVATIPTAPANVTAAVDTLAVDETVGCTTAIERVALSWDRTGLAGSFDRYEIERSEDGGGTWFPIATIFDETIELWHDSESRYGADVSYRVRVIRADSAFSDWATTVGSVVKELAAPVVVFTSNYAQVITAAYDYRPGRQYTFHAADEQVNQAVYGRDYQLGFQPSEERGATVTLTLLVGIDDKLPPGGNLGQAAFDQLRAISRASVPYVCALDHLGNRWMGMLRVPEGNQDAQGGADRYIIEVTVTEETATPYVVQITS